MTRASNGWCKKRKNPGGQIRWRAGYRAPDGSRPTKTFDHEREGWEWIRAELAKIGEVEALGGDPAAGNEPLRKFWDASIPLRQLKPKTAADAEYIWRKWLEPYVADTPVRAFGHVVTIDRLVAAIRKDGCSDSTVWKVIRFLKPVLNYAVELGALGRNAASSYKRARAPRPRLPEILDGDAQVWELADAIGQDHRALVLVLGYGGFRIGEALALRVADFDPMRGKVKVTKNVVDVAGKLVEQNSTKTYENREVDLPASVRDELVAHLHRRRIATKKDALIFAAARGGLLSANNFLDRHLRPAAISIGVVPSFRTHWLRHTAASFAIRDSGGNVLTVQRMLGHASPKMTLDIYAHLFDRSQETRVAITEDAIQRARFGEDSNVVAMGGAR